EERAALAAYQQAMDAIDRGEATGGEALRALVDRFPDSAAADKAVKFLATHANLPEELVELVDWLDGVSRRHQRFTVADNALWWAAFLRARGLADLAGARADLRRLVETFPDSPLADDALWALAGLHARQGQWAEAEAACQALVDLRNEASLLVGSYRSPLLDDAALQIGALRYHGRRDPKAAVWAYQAFLADFPTSTLRDDAWLALAHAQIAAGDVAAGRASLQALLREQPESRHGAEAKALLAAESPRPWPMDAARLAPPPLAEAP
ncbi:MAG: tetratricopeptide repeat protein, partial [Myxococcales bacterium]|nr:tetratricopeptide repeat protein [Myxococcales bacterium]